MKKLLLPIFIYSAMMVQGQDNAVAVKAYQNYDFVPGNKILFEDDFRSDMDGEFPAHWKLKSGQAVVNKINGVPAFVLTEGNYAVVKPRMKTEKYLGSVFTVEFDYYIRDGADYGVAVFFTDTEGDESRGISFGKQGDAETIYFNTGLTGTYRGDKEAFDGKWHHVAIAVKNQQMKCYVDEHRVLVVPDCEFTAVAVAIGGIAEIRITNVRIADGGGMNMIDKLTTDGKIVTHGITFDVNKASIKPESMGTLNMIVQVMNEKPTLKFEVGGHTDSDGDDAYNQKLSQQRAEAVKTQLIKMGIDGSRLTAKGYGESQPVNDNSSPENKANNRRVEFTKQ